MGGQWQTGISGRERQVLAAVVRYRTNAQIARELSISVRTVESHVASLLRKFGVGDRRALADLVRPTVDETPPGPTPVAGVPAGRDAFVGREEVGEQVAAGLSHARLVTLLGPGGIGKSRLAVRVVESIGHRFADGGAFVDLVGVSRGFVAQTVAAAFEVGELPLQTLANAVVERVGDDRALVVLDNCDQLIDETSDLVGELLAGCPRLAVLVTSRQRLGVVGERTVHVPPLRLESEAVPLFAERARSVDPDFAAEPDALIELCALLDGVPLTIELAAARVGSLGVDGLREALDDRLRALAGGRGSDPRHRSLRDVVGWGYDLLTADEQALFRRLAVFTGGFDIPAATSVSQGTPRALVTDLIGRLVDRSLLVRRPVASGSRWTMLASIRAFAAEQLRASAEEGAVRRSHLEWAAATASALETRRGSTWRDAFDEVADDLRAAVTATADEPDDVAHRLARSVGRLTFARGAFAESGRHHEAAAARASSAESAHHDLSAAAEAAAALLDGPTAYRRLLEAAHVADVEGHSELRTAALAKAVIVANRFPARLYVPPDARAADLLRDAPPSADTSLAALVALAQAWGGGGAAGEPDLRLSEKAVEVAGRADDAVLDMGALDALGAALALSGRLRDAYRIAGRRLQVAATLPRDRPDAVVEVVDAFHSATTAAMRVGLPADALAIAGRARTEDPTGDHPIFAALREALPLAVTGRFDEAIYRVEALWEALSRLVEPPRWSSPPLLAAALAYGLRGDPDADLWRSRALTAAGVSSPERSVHLGALAAFVAARVAVHAGGSEEAASLVAQCFGGFPAPRHLAYAEAVGAELAVVANLPDAAGRVVQARASAAENAWAAAVLRRTVGRMTDDRAELCAAVDRFEALDARFERACTMVLIPGRSVEAHAEFAAMGCRPPAAR